MNSLPIHPKVPSRICSECGEEKIIHDFSKQAGYQSHRKVCKVCLKKRYKPTTSQTVAKYEAGPKINFGNIY